MTSHPTPAPPVPMPDAELLGTLARLRADTAALLADVRALRDQTAEHAEAARRLCARLDARAGADLPHTEAEG